jgi:hypothetical protein
VATGKRKGGRVTPKKSATPAASGRRGRRSLGPSRIGPFEKPDPRRPAGQVGRRPSSPAKLFVFFVLYFACGIVAFVTFTGSLRIILGVLFIGVSLFWLRGAATAYTRQQQQRAGAGAGAGSGEGDGGDET